MVSNLNVNPKTQSKTINITENGDYNIVPDLGYLLSDVIAKVNISGVALIDNAIKNTNKYGNIRGLICSGISKYTNYAIFPIFNDNLQSYIPVQRLIAVLNNEGIAIRTITNNKNMYISSSTCYISDDTVDCSDYNFSESFDYMFVAWN